MLNESSLSRVFSQTDKHQSGTISAFRYASECGTGEKYKKNENLKRNSVLAAKLLKQGYGITKIKGSYIENYNTDDAREVSEDSFLVIDLKSKGKLLADLVKLGQEFEQDSITFSEAGHDSKYILVSTNTCPNAYPGSGRVGVAIKLGKAMFSKSGEFLSRVNGRPFVFENITAPVHDYESLSISSKLAVSVLENEVV